MLGVHGAAEELDAVVLVEVDLHEIHLGPVPDALEGDAVQLVVRADFGAGELHAHIAQDAAVVVRVRSAVLAGVAFPLGDAAGDVERRGAVDDESAPVAPGAVPVALVARHDDRRLTRSHRQDTAAAGDHQRAVRGAAAVDPRSRFDGQGRAGGHEHRAFEQHFPVRGPGGVRPDRAAHDQRAGRGCRGTGRGRRRRRGAVVTAGGDGERGEESRQGGEEPSGSAHSGKASSFRLSKGSGRGKGREREDPAAGFHRRPRRPRNREGHGEGNGERRGEAIAGLPPESPRNGAGPNAVTGQRRGAAATDAADDCENCDGGATKRRTNERRRKRSARTIGRVRRSAAATRPA